MESARRWSGYVCPDCRFVFRVPRDHDGKGIVCPSCRRILRIPTAGDNPSPLIASVRRAGSEEIHDDGTHRKSKKKRRGKKGDSTGNLEWERQSSGSSRSEKKQMRLMLIGGSALFTLIVAGVIIGMNSGSRPTQTEPLKPLSMKPSEASIAVPRRTEAVLAAEAEPLARKFLEATRVEDILPLVRNPEATEARIRKYFPDGGIPAMGLSMFNSTGAGEIRPPFICYSVTTRDHQEKPLCFIEGPQGLKIDWESWVGWSELSWEEFLSKKPTAPHVFRLKLAPIEYYNFQFKDDLKWQSYRLESPDGEHSVYGYVEKASMLDGQLRPAGEAKSVMVMLSLKFPEGAASPNQVLVDRFVIDGWLLENEKP